MAVMMENRIEYVPIWIRLGELNMELYCLGGVNDNNNNNNNNSNNNNNNINTHGERVKSFNELLIKASALLPPRPVDASLSDELLHIYTSGTTGLPKAAVIRGYRALFMCGGVGAACRMVPSDVVYNALPLYHSNGGLALTGNTIRIGTTLVIRKKFSASRYFEDCYRHNVTVVNYIGETCRYLLATQRGQFDRQHCIRVATGNGLRASIWKEFQERFNIPLCVEFYGSTEGNANMVNTVGKVGAVGFNSVLCPCAFPIKLVKIDADTGDILRGSNGLVIGAATGEVGMLVGKVKSDEIHKFDGYINATDTAKKVARDVFTHGDSAFMTGDMLVQDEEGFYYFQVRWWWSFPYICLRRII